MAIAATAATEVSARKLEALHAAILDAKSRCDPTKEVDRGLQSALDLFGHQPFTVGAIRHEDVARALAQTQSLCTRIKSSVARIEPARDKLQANMNAQIDSLLGAPTSAQERAHVE